MKKICLFFLISNVCFSSVEDFKKECLKFGPSRIFENSHSYYEKQNAYSNAIRSCDWVKQKPYCLEYVCTLAYFLGGKITQQQYKKKLDELESKVDSNFYWIIQRAKKFELQKMPPMETIVMTLASLRALGFKNNQNNLCDDTLRKCFKTIISQEIIDLAREDSVNNLHNIQCFVVFFYSVFFIIFFLSFSSI